MSDLSSIIPDLQDWSSVSQFVDERLDHILRTDFTQKPLQAVTYTAPAHADPVLGVYGDEAWRRFALGIFIADWASYTAPADRGDFARMLSVIAAFPQGFRLYLGEDEQGQRAPVGYTGWYPVSADIFNLLHHTPERVTHRGFMVPLKEQPKPDQDNYLYLFNYSVTPALSGTPQSSALVKDFAASLQDVSYTGLSAVTVSPHGARIAEKFGMSYRGDMTHDGEAEGVYTLKI
jgi:hypothetical protein